jgi:hypothetical protein
MHRQVALAVVVLLGGGVAFGKPVKKKAPVAPPPPPVSFEQRLADAEPVGDLGVLVEPLFDACDPADPLEYRRCEGSRSFLETEARGKTYVATGDAASVTVSPYDKVTKEVDLDVVGCLACLHPVHATDAKATHFVTTRAPRAIKDGRALGLDVATHELTLRTPEAQHKWQIRQKRVVPRMRTQYIFKLGPIWKSGAFTGVSFIPLAYRVIDACTGQVYVTSPSLAEGTKPQSAGPVTFAAGDALSCPAPEDDLTPEEVAERDEEASRPEELSPEAIEHALAVPALKERLHECHTEFEETGTVSLALVVEGPTGRVKEIHAEPPFDKSPGGLCAKAAVKDASFPRFKAATQEFKVPVSLR